MRTPKSGEDKQQTVEIGKRLRKLRKDAKLSLQEIADRLNKQYGANTNKGMISKYENGVHEPSAGTLYCLSRILGVSVDYILGRTDMPADKAPEPGAETTACALEVFTRYNPSDGGALDTSVTELIPHTWMIGGRAFFGLKIADGSLAPRYYKDDVIIFERRSKVERDRVALVSVGEEDAFVCFVIKKHEGKIIRPLDPSLEEHYYTTQELADIPVHIIGAAVQVRRIE